ncbi:hypothetical protein C8R44DRAFT_754157 [Mycena epipterygia]|nr:hypothetical protein C8R44DRAFT_754157 [Mycena epipterygia]
MPVLTSSFLRFRRLLCLGFSRVRRGSVSEDGVFNDEGRHASMIRRRRTEEPKPPATTIDVSNSNHDCQPIGPTDFESFNSVLTFGASASPDIHISTGGTVLPEANRSLFGHSITFGSIPLPSAPECFIVADASGAAARAEGHATRSGGRGAELRCCEDRGVLPNRAKMNIASPVYAVFYERKLLSLTGNLATLGTWPLGRSGTYEAGLCQFLDESDGLIDSCGAVDESPGMHISIPPGFNYHKRGKSDLEEHKRVAPISNNLLTLRIQTQNHPIWVVAMSKCRVLRSETQESSDHSRNVQKHLVDLP